MFRNLHMVAAADLRLGALLLFFLIFLAVLVRFYVLRRREDFVALSRLPLQDDLTEKEPAP
jgi:cbb3-type cytochrome oxidase subunit 3